MHWNSAFFAALIASSCLGVACGDDAATSAMSPASGVTAGVSAPPPAAAGTAGVQAMAPAGAGATTRGSGGAQASGAGAGAGAAAMPSGGPAATAPMVHGMCCSDGKCLCRGEAPAALSGEAGPYAATQYPLAGVGCVFHPKDAAPPFAAVAIADGFGGSGGCASVQTGAWGPFYASHGIVALIVDTGSGDQPNARGEALTKAITALEAENEKNASPLFGKLAGRYGTSGFSMGGGGSVFASKADSSLLSSIAIMPWGKGAEGSTVPTLILCGAKDGVAPCTAYGTPAYASIGASVSKMRVTVAGPHDARPSADGNRAGAYALAFQKVFLEGDPRWRPLLVAAESDESTIR